MSMFGYGKKQVLSQEEQDAKTRLLTEKANTGINYICKNENRTKIANAAAAMVKNKNYSGLQAAAKKIQTQIPAYNEIVEGLNIEMNRVNQRVDQRVGPDDNEEVVDDQQPDANAAAGVFVNNGQGPGGGGGRRRTKKFKYYNKRRRTKGRRTKRRRSNKRRN